MIQTISELANNKIQCSPHKIKNIPQDISKAVEELSASIEKEYPEISNSRWIALRLLEGDTQIIEALKTGTFI